MKPSTNVKQKSKAKDPQTIAQWCKHVHTNAHSKGFYTRRVCGPLGCRHQSGNVTSAIMLVVTELAEAVEALRKNNLANFREEIADAVIRLFDLAAAGQIDLQEELVQKTRYNAGRPFRHNKSF